MRQFRPYTTQEVDFIKDNYMRLTHQQIADQLGRPVQSINITCSRLGYIKARGPWQDNEIEYLKTHIKTKSLTELSIALKRSVHNVRTQVRALNLHAVRRKAWTTKEVEYLKQHHERTPVSEMAQTLGRSIASIKSQITNLGFREDQPTTQAPPIVVKETATGYMRREGNKTTHWIR